MKRAAIVTAIMLSGCATQDLRKDITRLERSINDLRAFQAEQTDTINSLDSQVKALSGRLEELEFSQNKRLGQDLSSLKEDLSSLRRRVPPPAIVPASELEVDEVWANSVAEEAGRLLTDSLQRLREGKFNEAIPLLQNAVEQLDGTDRAAVPLFWEGVAFDGLHDDRQALRAYAEVVSRYPKSQRAPSSLLRQASVLVRLGDPKAARLSLQKLLDDYPRAPEAAIAKDKLRDLK
jgi:TolA-binding protein